MASITGIDSNPSLLRKRVKDKYPVCILGKVRGSGSEPSGVRLRNKKVNNGRTTDGQTEAAVTAALRGPAG